MKNHVSLKALEAKASEALFGLDEGTNLVITSSREFTEIMKDIKASEAYKEAKDSDGKPFRYFATYYNARWADKAERSCKSVRRAIAKLAAAEEFAEAVAGWSDRTTFEMPSGDTALILRGRIPDPEERVEAWKAFTETGEPVGTSNANLRAFVDNYVEDEDGNPDYRAMSGADPDEPITADFLGDPEFRGLLKDVLHPEPDYAADVAFRILANRMVLKKTTPEAVAKTVIESETGKFRDATLDTRIEACRWIANFYSELADAIVEERRTPLKAVK